MRNKVQMNKKQGYKRHGHEHRDDLAGEYRWGDTGQLLLFIIFIAGMISDLFIFRVSIQWQDTFPWYFRLIIFIPLVILSVFFGHNAHKKIFKEQREEIEVIDTGVYGLVRHPLYLGSILAYLSFVFLSFSVVTLSIFIVVILFYYYLCRYEEDLLTHKVGNDYKKYMKKVPMLIPGLKVMKK